MADFCTLMDKNAPSNHPKNVKTMPKSPWCEDWGTVLTLDGMAVLVAF